MPYNNTPIAPSSEITGTVSLPRKSATPEPASAQSPYTKPALPVARVQKIIHADEDIANCSKNAAFVITAATEMFIRYLVEQTHNQVKSERKPRRTIQYKDIANAVARVDNLEFLADVVPRTMTFKQHKEKLAKEKADQTSHPHPGEPVNSSDAMDVDPVVSRTSQSVPAPPPGTNGVPLD
ncbi:hypothetical protein H2203_006006 [Taxawa tesnikishii (nom. ined.)]|nr:hypothetical protein H2203_006006 [Dothideales sp. JES 119]